MLTLPQSAEYPDLEILWQDICQIRHTEGVAAFLYGLPQARLYSLHYDEIFANTDFLLRFFERTWIEQLAVYLRVMISGKKKLKSCRKLPQNCF